MDGCSGGAATEEAERPEQRLGRRGAVFLSPRRRGCQAAQQPGAAAAAGMASVQYDNSAFYLLVLALLCMYLVPGASIRPCPPAGAELLCRSWCAGCVQPAAPNRAALRPATIAFCYWECSRPTYTPSRCDSAARRKANTPSLSRFRTFWFGVYVAAWALLLYLLVLDDVVQPDAAEFNPFEILGLAVRPRRHPRPRPARCEH